MSRRLVAACSIVATGAVVLSVGGTDAAWTDAEWVAGQIGVIDCADMGTYTSRGEGRFLTGDALGLALGQVVDVPGVTVVNDGADSSASGGVALGDDAYANPLTGEVLSLIDVDLTSVIELPLSAEVGIVNQYARAASNGESAGASGLVNDSGAVLVSAEPTGPQLPGWASVRLSRVVSQTTGEAVADLVAGLADLSLELGAIAARAQLDACSADYGGTLTGALERDYAIASLDARIETPLVSGLTTAAATTIVATNTLVADVAGDEGVVSAVVSGVGGLLDGALGTLGLGNVAVSGPTIDVNLSDATALLTGTIASEDGLVEVDLDAGTVTVDLAAVLGAAYGGTDGSLNGLQPNTELLVDEDVLTVVTATLTTSLADWVEDVLAALTAAVLAAEVGLTAEVTIATALGIPVATVTAVIDDASLASLHDGTATVGVTTSVALLDALCPSPNPLNPFCGLRSTVNTVLGTVTGRLVSGLGPLVGEILYSALFDEEAGPDEHRLRIDLSPIEAAVDALVGVVGTTLSGFFGAGGLASLLVNVQNVPQAGGPAPDDWGSLPSGSYAVGALRIGVLGVLGPSVDVHLDLATASVGANNRLPRRLRTRTDGSPGQRTRRAVQTTQRQQSS